MGITQALVEQHIEKWSLCFRRHRVKVHWPAYVFHVAQASTAAKIIQSEHLIPRASLPDIEHDVANQSALNNNTDTHQYCRLHFRPRNNFHFSREGIKVIGDAHRPHDGEKQLSVPVMFAFDARTVLTMPQTCFCPEPGSIRKLIRGDDDAFFQSMDFQKIYHNEYTTPENNDEIQALRMAEALVLNDLSLENHLKRVICRTLVDVQTLRSYLREEEWQKYRDIIQVEQTPGAIFFHKGAYIKQLYFDSDNILNVELHLADRQPASKTTYDFSIKRQNGENIDWTLSLRMPAKYRLSGATLNEGEVVEIYLEDVLAYRGVIKTALPDIL